MAKIYLDANEILTVGGSNSTTTVVGAGGTEKVVVSGTQSVVLDSNIERVELSGNASAYTYAITGNVVTVKSGATTVATLTVPEGPGQTVAFADGSAVLKITGLNAATLGGTAVQTTAAALVPTLNTADKSAAGLTATVAAGQSFSLSGSTDTLLLTAGNDTVVGGANTLATGDVILDASTTDNDTATLTVNAAAAPTISNVENVTLNFGLISGTTTLSAVTGAKVITLGSADASVVTATVDGVKTGNTFDISNLVSTVTLATSSTLDNTEAATLKLNGNSVTLTNTNTSDIDVLTLNSTGAANTVTLFDTADLFSLAGEKIIATGDKNLTIKSAATDHSTGLASATIEKSMTGGATLTVQLFGALNDATSINLSKIAADKFVVGTTDAVKANLTLASGTTLKASASLTHANDATVLSSTSAGTITFNPTADQDSNTLNFNNFATVNVNVTDTVTINQLTLGEAATLNPALLNITGTDSAPTLTLTKVDAKVINASTYVGSTEITNNYAGASITGGSGVDTINSGDVSGVTINGGAGNDVITADVLATKAITINGDAGNDKITTGVATTTSTYNGGVGDDTFTAAAINTTVGNFVGGDGTDTLKLTLGGVGVPNDVSTNTFTLSSIEVIDTTAATTNLVTFAAPQLSGQVINFVTDAGGKVAIAAPAAAATIDLSGINHTVMTSFTINGSTGADIIKGTKAADVIIGNTGADTLTGGSGADSFVFEVNSTNDNITDFTNGDKLVMVAAASAVAGTFVNSLATLTVSQQAAIDLAASVTAAITPLNTALGAIAVNTAVLFTYGGTQYVFMNEDTANTYDIASDAIVKVVGLTATSTFDAGTFVFVAV